MAARADSSQKKPATIGKFLIVVTNHSQYPSRKDATGLWLTELTHFYDILNDAGYSMDFASPKGGSIPLDERSLGWPYLDKSAKAYLKTPIFMGKLAHTLAVRDVNPSEYFAIYFTSGHRTMWDFRDDLDLKKAMLKNIVNAVEQKPDDIGCDDNAKRILKKMRLR